MPLAMPLSDLVRSSLGVTPEAILEEYSGLEPEDIRAGTAYAHVVIASDSLSAMSIAES